VRKEEGGGRREKRGGRREERGGRRGEGGICRASRARYDSHEHLSPNFRVAICVGDDGKFVFAPFFP
jgi:hypothetical protein